ncbi:MAG: histidinol-phosphatase [Hyphomonadaceae bacterium]|nr:histidinol-phosphatase [Hyphomonadaceae bacterium]
MDTLYPQEHSETLALIQRLVEVSRPITLGHFRSDPETETKGSGRGYDPVTVADRDAEAAIRAILEHERPADSIIGEEHGTREGTSGWTWYLDPIDGTRAYVAGLTSWTTLIGLAGPDGMPVYGAIACPAVDELYLGWPGGAGLLQGERAEPIAVSPCQDLRQARISTTDPFIFTPAEEGAWTHLRATARISRYGLDAYAYARLAAGTLDLVAESGLKPWDVAALVPVVRGAGGLALDWRGRPATASGGQLVCAASRPVIDQALLALKRSAE